MKLSKKLKIFCKFFPAFLKCKFNLEYLGKKYEYSNLCLSEIIDCERRAYENV